MKSIFARIILWSLATFALSMLAYWLIKRNVEHRGPSPFDPFFSMVKLIEDETSRAFEEGGSERLAEHLRRLDRTLGGTHILTDVHGRDLATGEDYSSLLRPGGRFGEPLKLPDGRAVFVGFPLEGKYRFLSILPPWFEPPNLLPYYGAVVLVIVGMGAILAASLGRPIGRLHRVVERFGRGDYEARVQAQGVDEIAQLSNAFDQMADRIVSLLASERRLLSDVSHELRSPLARLDVAIDLAMTSDDPGPTLTRIRRDVDRLSQLVGELLQLNRAEGEPSSLDLSPLDLDSLIREVTDDCRVEAGAASVELATLGSGGGRTLADHELLRRAIENVLRNAIRYAPAGSRVEVTATTDGSTHRVEIRDFGPGVPESSLTSLFQPFYRVEGHRSRASGGVGLGLAIAQRAVQIHQGRIFASNAGPGLRVVIELPHRQAEA